MLKIWNVIADLGKLDSSPVRHLTRLAVSGGLLIVALQGYQRPAGGIALMLTLVATIITTLGVGLPFVVLGYWWRSILRRLRDDSPKWKVGSLCLQFSIQMTTLVLAFWAVGRELPLLLVSSDTATQAILNSGVHLISSLGFVGVFYGILVAVSMFLFNLFMYLSERRLYPDDVHLVVTPHSIEA
jgi:hypothetical protein